MGNEHVAEQSILQTSYPLSADQVRDFQLRGHIYLPGLLPESQIEFYRQSIADAVRVMNTENRPLEKRDTYGKAFLQIFNLWRQHEVLRNFVLAERFGEVAAALLGVDRVRIYHDQALFKEPGGGHTPWHQDQFYWPLDTDKTITMWMPMVDLDNAMGIMKFASGSHKNGPILSREISDDSEKFFADYVKEHNFPIEGRDEMAAGDATFHTGWTLHNAPPNRTDRMREVMTIIYFADRTKILQPENSYRENDLKTWLGGKRPGEFADSELNPVV